MSLFWILDKDGNLRRFEPNAAQREFAAGLQEHTRHLVLKARQLGISTFTELWMLGELLFRANFKAAIVDKTQDDGDEKIDKMRFAYEHLDYLPENPSARDVELAAIGRMIKEYHGDLVGKKPSDGRPCVVSRTGVLQFCRTGSVVRARVTYRGGTIQMLHVSELGRISVREPKRAREIVTGSFNSAGKNCSIVCESTHEGGKSGTHYEQVVAAMDNIGKPLSNVHFRFWFFPWWQDAGYVLDAPQEIGREDAEYFAAIERQCGMSLREEQKWWYVSMKQTQRSMMRQEYPSVPDEALSPVMDGTIFAREIMALRESGNLTRSFEPERHLPIYTAWDLGFSDFTSIWWFQPTGDGRWLVLDCYTANRLRQEHYIGVMREHDALWGHCAVVYLPHDGESHNNLGLSFADGMRRAGYTVRRVPRTSDAWLSVDNARELLRSCIFHRRCSEQTRVGVKVYDSGVGYLQNYHTDNDRSICHDESSHASDAFRTFADAVARGLVAPHRGYEVRSAKPGRLDRVVEDYLN
ncbi:MAG: hypothetical protein ACI4O9_08045 [Akkermansia sp.]